MALNKLVIKLLYIFFFLERLALAKSIKRQSVRYLFKVRKMTTFHFETGERSFYEEKKAVYYFQKSPRDIQVFQMCKLAN